MNKQKCEIYFLILISICSFLAGCRERGGDEDVIMTVNGPIDPCSMGVTLVHEHVLVDFVGAEKVSKQRYDRAIAEMKIAPYLKQAKEAGVETFIECTPEYLGRDVKLLKSLTEKTGLNIITNTGFYGAINDKYIPEFAYGLSAEQLAEIWITEWQEGINGSDVKPGFIKISVDKDLAGIDANLVKAGCITHLETGLVIASHTPGDDAAKRQLEIIESYNIDPNGFIWVHAQTGSEEGRSELAKKGVWISIDNVRDNQKNISEKVEIITRLAEKGLLDRVLISHDAGWYNVGDPYKFSYRVYTTIFEKLIPALKEKGFTDSDIEQLMIDNPRRAFTIKIIKK